MIKEVHHIHHRDLLTYPHHNILCFPFLPGCQQKKRFADMNLCHEFTPNIPFFDAIRQSHQRNWRSCKGTSTPGDVTEEVKTWCRKQDMSCWRANAKSNMLPNNMLPGCLTRKKQRLNHALIIPVRDLNWFILSNVVVFNPSTSWPTHLPPQPAIVLAGLYRMTPWRFKTCSTKHTWCLCVLSK